MYYKILKYIFWTKLIATYDAINLFQEFIKVNINNINEKKKPFFDVPDSTGLI